MFPFCCLIFSVIQCYSVLFSAIQCYSVLFSAIQCYSVLFSWKTCCLYQKGIKTSKLNFLFNFSPSFFKKPGKKGGVKRIKIFLKKSNKNHSSSFYLYKCSYQMCSKIILLLYSVRQLCFKKVKKSNRKFSLLVFIPFLIFFIFLLLYAIF